MPTEHATTTVDEQNQAKEVLARIIAHRRGRDNAISGEQLAEAVKPSKSTVYDLIPEIRREYQLPIGSCSKGYFVIEDREEYIRHTERYESQIETAKRHKSDLEEAFEG